MKQQLFLTSPLPPSVNSYLNYRVASTGRKHFVQSYPSNETKIYQKNFSKYINEQLLKQNWITPDKNKIVYVECSFYLDRKRKDPNNLLKVMFDVLTSCKVYEDDDNVLPMSKRLFIDAKNPRIELRIYVGDEVGVFKDQKEYELFFDENCRNCSKKPEKCTILRKLLENRIIEQYQPPNTCLSKKNKTKKELKVEIL